MSASLSGWADLVEPFDIVEEASKFSNFNANRMSVHHIVDEHVNLSGVTASILYSQVANLFGIGECWTRTMLKEAEVIKKSLEKENFLWN